METKDLPSVWLRNLIVKIDKKLSKFIYVMERNYNTWASAVNSSDPRKAKSADNQSFIPGQKHWSQGLQVLILIFSSGTKRLRQLYNSPEKLIKIIAGWSVVLPGAKKRRMRISHPSITPIKIGLLRTLVQHLGLFLLASSSVPRKSGKA